MEETDIQLGPKSQAKDSLKNAEPIENVTRASMGAAKSKKHKHHKKDATPSREKLQWDEPVKKNTGLIDKEVNLHLNLRTLMKMGLVVALLVGVFFVGKMSSAPLTLQVEEGGPINSLLGLFISDDPVSEQADPEASKTPEGELPPTATTESAVGQPAEVAKAVEAPKAAEPVKAAAPPIESQPTLTDYDLVDLEIRGVRKQWKGTWGKITFIDYTITNNAQKSKVVRDQLVMLVEGYSDVPKNIPLSDVKIPAGGVEKGTVAVPSGFAYNEVTAGDLSSIDLTFQLLDKEGKVMALGRKTADLTG